MLYIFTSFVCPNAPQNSHQMKYTNVSQCLTWTFEKAGVFASSKTFKRVSPSRLHFSIITELVSLGEDNLDNIVLFCKTRKGGLQNILYSIFLQQRSSKVVMEMLYILHKFKWAWTKGSKTEGGITCKEAIPTSRKISKWYKNKINLGELEKNIDLTDKGLEYQIDRFQDEIVLKDGVLSASDTRGWKCKHSKRYKQQQQEKRYWRISNKY